MEQRDPPPELRRTQRQNLAFGLLVVAFVLVVAVGVYFLDHGDSGGELRDLLGGPTSSVSNAPGP